MAGNAGATMVSADPSSHAATPHPAALVSSRLATLLVSRAKADRAMADLRDRLSCRLAGAEYEAEGLEEVVRAAVETGGTRPATLALVQDFNALDERTAPLRRVSSWRMVDASTLEIAEPGEAATRLGLAELLEWSALFDQLRCRAEEI